MNVKRNSRDSDIHISDNPAYNVTPNTRKRNIESEVIIRITCNVQQTGKEPESSAVEKVGLRFKSLKVQAFDS
jgi:hypothetical protein